MVSTQLNNLDEITNILVKIFSKLPEIIVQSNLNMIGNFFSKLSRVNRELASLLFTQLKSQVLQAFEQNMTITSLMEISFFLKCINNINPKFVQRIFKSYDSLIENKFLSEINKLTFRNLSSFLRDIGTLNRFFTKELLEKFTDDLINYFKKRIHDSDLKEIAEFLITVAEIDEDFTSKLLSESTIKMTRRISSEPLDSLANFLSELAKFKTALDIFLSKFLDVIIVRIDQAKRRNEDVSGFLDLLRNIAPDLLSKVIS